MQVKIRQETPDDFKRISEINELAFQQETEAKLISLLRKSISFVPELSLVATHRDQLAGHILFSRVEIINEDLHQFESLALAPMAVLPEYQNQGIGGQLIKYGLERAKELKFKSVIVLGHEHYYPKFGFVPAEKWNIKPPFEVPKNVFMAIALEEKGLNGVSGTVRYPKEFEEV